MAKLLNRKQYNKWLTTLPNNYCTLCNWKEHQIVLFEGYDWVWIANIAPYWKRHTMLMPKRHFKEYGEMTNSEAVELKQLIHKVTNRYKELGYKRYIHFWRNRVEKPKVRKLDHFHVHFCDDYDGLWDDIIDPKATDWDVEELK